MARVLAACCLLAWGTSLAAAQDKEDGPRIACATPLGVLPGETIRVKIRGWKIGDAAEVKFTSPQIQVKILNKGGAPLPNRQEAKQVGDTQVEVELVIAKEATASEISFSVVTPAGETKPHPFFIGGSHPVVAEREPNEGFRQAQSLELRQIVTGQIQQDRDVDVFSITLKKRSSLDVEIFAARYGSAFDSTITLFDERGQFIATSDDQTDTRDSRISCPLAPGRYFLALQDSHDRGGPAHPYRFALVVTPE